VLRNLANNAKPIQAEIIENKAIQD